MLEDVFDECWKILCMINIRKLIVCTFYLLMNKIIFKIMAFKLYSKQVVAKIQRNLHIVIRPSFTPAQPLECR